MKNLIILIIAIIVGFNLNCVKKTENDKPENDKSIAELVSGTYIGHAKRIYYQPPDCVCARDFSNYEKSGEVKILLTAKTDSTVYLSIVSTNNYFQAFSINSLLIRKDKDAFVSPSRSIIRGNGSFNEPYITINLKSKSIEGQFDLSHEGCSERLCGLGYGFNEFNYINFLGNKQ